jgi:hypothetical protein
MFVLYVSDSSLYRAKTSVPAGIIPGSESEPTTYWEKIGTADFDYNGSREITRVGIPNVTPGGTTASEFLDNFFYPSKAPGLSISLTNPTREFGSSNSIAIPYTVTKYTKGVTAITINGDSVAVGSNIDEDSDPSGSTQSGTHGSTVTVNVNATITAQVDTVDETVTEEVNITWLGKKFLTKSDVDYFTPSSNDATISTFLNAIGTGFSLSASRAINEMIDPADQYIYIFYQDSLGGDIDYNFFIQGVATNGWDVKTFTYTNQYGYTSTYRLIKTKYKLTGEYLVEVR